MDYWSIAPLISSWLITSHPFQIINVRELLPIYQLLKTAPELNNPRFKSVESYGQFEGLIKSVKFVCRNATVNVSICAMMHHPNDV